MSRQPKTRGERGAITIQVAFALIALIGFTTFVVDYGVMWVSRRQAQNGADAGALAGAIGMMQEGNDAAAILSARHFADNSVVWGQGNSAANVDVALSGPSVNIPPCGIAPGCIRVDIMRNQPDRAGALRGNPLPTYFGSIVGINSQGVRATATAQLGSGNAIRCLLPFAVIDRWKDDYDTNKDATYYPYDPLTGTQGWSPNDKYEPTLGDTYIAPYGGNTSHTGWTVDGDYGRQLIIKDGDVGDYSAGWAQKIDLVGSTGASDYSWNIQNCNPTPIGIATASEPCAPAPGGDTTGREINGCVSVGTGMSQGPTVQNGINPLVAQDPGAYWSATAAGPGGKTGAVVDSSGTVSMNGPRIRPIVIFDINHYIASGCTGTNCIGKVANIVGFFVEGACGDVESAGRLTVGNTCENPSKDIVGRIVTIPGSFVAGVGTTESSAAFVMVIRLVR
jgi:hypothetical protein